MLAAAWLGAALFVTATIAQAGPIAGGVWYQFSFTGSDVRGCDPNDPGGAFCIPGSRLPTEFLDAPPWTFIAPAPGTSLQLVDAFESGDRFQVFDFGISIGFTSVPTPGLDCGDDPGDCLAMPGISSGTFILGAGAHSIILVPIASPFGFGSGYLRVGGTAALAEPGSIALLALGMASLLGWRTRRNGRR